MTRARGLLAAPLTALAGCLVLTAPASAAPASAMAPAGGGFGGQLNGVSCVTAGDCWAVGQTQNTVAVADHWNGSAWSVAHLPAPAGAGPTDLLAISCTGLTSCWAVGDYGSVTTSKYLPYAEHWNGTAWSVVPMPHPASSFVTTPVAVSCSGDANCWAAGSATGQGTQLLERWNGHAWALEQAPAISAQATLLGLFCASAADCWLTGENAKGGPLAAHWDGTAWSVTPAPASSPTPDELLSIACQAGDCLAVGDRDQRTFAEHWNGTSWTITPTGNVNGRLAGVSCAAGHRCVAAGLTIHGRVFSEVWNGSAWRIVMPAPIGSVGAGFEADSCVTAADCWAVGSRFNGTNSFSLIEHWNGTAWSVVP